MTTKIISGTITTGYSLSGLYTELSIASTGVIDGGVLIGGGASLVNAGLIEGVNGVALTAGGSATNAGTIIGTGTSNNNAAIELSAVGTFTNVAGALAQGYNGVRAGGADTVINSGTIEATNAAIYMTNTAVAGVVINNAGGTIMGGNWGVFAFPDATVTNAGLIEGGSGVFLAAGGSVTNNGAVIATGASNGLAAIRLLTGGSFTNGVGALAQGYDGVLLNGGSATVTNSGTIIGTGAGNGSAAIMLYGGGTVTNNAGGTIMGGHWGVFAGAATTTTTVTNFGLIEGSQGAVQFGAASDRLIVEAGARFEGGVAGGGGTLELAAGTDTITGLGGAATLSGAATMTFGGFGAYVIDSGVTLIEKSPFAFGEPVTVTNFGTIAGATDSVLFTHTSDRLVVEAGSVFEGEVVGGGATLELASGTDTITGVGGTATLSGSATMTFSGFGSYVIDSGVTLTVESAFTFDGVGVTNAGTIQGGVDVSGGGAVVNGSAGAGAALISGLYGVKDGGGGAVNVVNFGTIAGTTDSVVFTQASDSLTMETGSVFVGEVVGGGGLLVLAGGSGTITGLGGAASLTGAVTASVRGFGSYAIGGGAQWTISGGGTLSAGQSLAMWNGGEAIVASGGILHSAGVVVGGGGGVLSVADGGAVFNTGTIENVADGGVGIIVAGGALTSAGTILGAKAAPDHYYLGGINNGQPPYIVPYIYNGGAGVLLTSGTVSNTAAGTIQGGAGGYYRIEINGGGGGAGVSQSGGSLANAGIIRGGAGGYGGYVIGELLKGAYGGGGGAGAVLSGGLLVNTGTIQGGVGGYGGEGSKPFNGYNMYGPGGQGGVGGDGVDLAGGSLVNAGTVQGGAGGAGRSQFPQSGRVGHGEAWGGGAGGAGGDGVTGSVESLANTGVIQGGAGGAGGAGAGSEANGGGTGGVGGAGVALRWSSLANTGTIQGGAGGAGGSADYLHLGSGGAGGAGVLLTGGALTNSGVIRGGAGGAPGAGAAGAAGNGVDVSTGGTVVNGAANAHSALISGRIGVYDGGGGAVSVTNFGTISGTVDSVLFRQAGDRLVAEAGSVFIGQVVGGGGTLELARGTGTITGLGGAGTVSGAEAISFNGFGTYQLDTGGRWTLTGTNTLEAGQVLIDNAAMANAGALTVSGRLTDNGQFANAAGGAITVANGGVVQIKRTVSNAGTITLASTGTNTDLRILSDGAMLTGGGTIVMSGPKARLLGSSPTTVLTNVDNTIIGTGQVGAGVTTLVNEAAGVIEAVGAGALVLSTPGETLINSGLIEGGNTGTLLLVTTTVNQTSGGSILAASGGHVNLRDDHVIGGTVGSTGTGVFAVTLAGGALDGTTSAVTVTGMVKVLNGANLTLEGAIDNTGKIALLATSKTADLVIGAAGATLTGHGQVDLIGTAADRVYGSTAAATLTNVDNRIVGGGLLGNDQMTLINEAAGVITDQNVKAALTIDTGANTIVNAGQIIASAGADVTIKSAIDNTGLLFVGRGTLTLDGAVTGAGVAHIYAGTLDAAGAFTENVVFVGATGVLELADSQAYTGRVTGLSPTGGSSLDLLDIAFTSGVTTATFADNGHHTGGVLTVTDGTHTAHIALAGDYFGDTFTPAFDAGTGTSVTVQAPMSPGGSPQAFVAAMAQFGGPAAISSHTGQARLAPDPVLYSPRVAMS